MAIRLDEVDWDTKICSSAGRRLGVGHVWRAKLLDRQQLQDVISARAASVFREREMSSVYFVSVRTRWSNLWEGILMSLAMLKHTA